MTPQQLKALCFLAVIFCFFNFFGAVASTNSAWSLRFWQSDDGLPNNDVTALAQTADGYLWLATPSRLARFDGERFDEFYQNNFAPGHNQRVTVFVAARDGSLWLPMDHGPLVHLKNGAAEIFTNNLPNMTAENALEDAGGAIWISYRNGELCCVRNGKIIQFSDRDGLPAARGDHALAIDSAGQFWLAQRGQLFRFYNGRFDFMAQLPNFTTQLAAARDGGLWVCSGNELLKYETSGLKEVGELNL
jgi:ligand-binding sensor domain-containing protein